MGTALRCEGGGSESSEDNVEDHDYVDGGKDEDDDGDCDDGGGYDDMNASTHWTLWEHVPRGCYILPKNLDSTSLPKRRHYSSSYDIVHRGQTGKGNNPRLITRCHMTTLSFPW